LQGNDCLGFMLTNLFPDWAKTIIFGANIISVYVLFNKKSLIFGHRISNSILFPAKCISIFLLHSECKVLKAQYQQATDLQDLTYNQFKNCDDVNL